MFGTRQHQKMKSIQQVPLQLRRRLSPFCGFPCLELKRGVTEDEMYINTPLDNTSIMDSMENEVRASAQATLDLKLRQGCSYYHNHRFQCTTQFNRREQ